MWILALVTSLLVGTSTLGLAPSAAWRSLKVAEVAAHPYMVFWPAKWSLERAELLYMGARQAPGESSWGPAMLLDLTRPTAPLQVTTLPAADPTWNLSGQQIAYLGLRHERPVDKQTVYRQDLPTGRPIDLLPGERAGRLISKIHGWLDNRILAYEDHLGTGVQQLGLVDTEDGAAVPLPTLQATSFKWSRNGHRVAGQWSGVIPEGFWLWDRQRGMLLADSQNLPGPSQWFEDWSPDGRSILFTAWERGSYEAPRGGKATLYRLDLESRAVTEIAKDAVAASWWHDSICYVKWGRRLKLVVANSADGKPWWTADLGRAKDEALRRLMTDRPTMLAGFVSYQTGDHRWLVSPIRRKASRLIYRGEGESPAWSPDARYLALLQKRKGEVGLPQETPHRLLVLRNPHPVRKTYQSLLPEERHSEGWPARNQPDE